MSVDERLQRLEQTARRWRKVAVLACLLAALAIGLELRPKRRITVTDGTNTLELTPTGLAIRGKAGVIGLNLVDGDYHGPMLVMNSGDAQAILQTMHRETMDYSFSSLTLKGPGGNWIDLDWTEKLLPKRADTTLPPRSANLHFGVSGTDPSVELESRDQRGTIDLVRR